MRRVILASGPRLLAIILGTALLDSGAEELMPGLEYRLLELNEPRPNRVHCLRVDLAKKTLHPGVVIAADPDGAGPAEAALTNPLKLASDPAIVAFINTNPWDSLPDAAGKKDRNWFEGQAVDIQGLAASGGVVRSAGTGGGASIWVDAGGRIRLGDVGKDEVVREGVAGFQPVVQEGAVVSAAGGPQHPRTAVGIERLGTVLWLVVVDGRQPRFSEGMTLQELGKQMAELGCWTAINLDGGGSSVLGLRRRGESLRVANNPSDGALLGTPRVRPVPTMLTLRTNAP